MYRFVSYVFESGEKKGWLHVCGPKRVLLTGVYTVGNNEFDQSKLHIKKRRDIITARAPKRSVRAAHSAKPRARRPGPPRLTPP